MQTLSPTALSPRQRVNCVLHRRPVDRLPACEGFWQETLDRWTAEGHLAPDEDPVSHFDLDLRRAGGLNCVADLDFEPVVLEETADTVLRLDGNGAKLRRHKHRSTTPEHVGFTVTDRSGWLLHAKPHLLDLDRRRIPFEAYRRERSLAQREARHFSWAGLAPFEQIHPMCGHEYMLMGMALDPDWVADMVQTYADLTLRHIEVLFAEEGLPDSVWFFEDMGYKKKPFMSPAMYAALIQPAHKRLFDFVHGLGLKVIVHSCGYVAPLVPGLVEAGMDCLQAMEVKAGMDLVSLAERFGGQISFCGNIDARTLAENDLELLRAEMDAKIPPLLEAGGSYMLHSDHSIPPSVEYSTYRFFLEYGRALDRFSQGAAIRGN